MLPYKCGHLSLGHHVLFAAGTRFVIFINSTNFFESFFAVCICCFRSNIFDIFCKKKKRVVKKLKSQSVKDINKSLKSKYI